MNPIRYFIHRPIATTLIMLGILIFGVVGYFQLPVSDLPNVDFPTITVSASLPGANPDTMSSSIATPLEQQFSTIAGLDSMTSTSSMGSTSITLQFNLSRSIDAAAQDVQAGISAALRKLPNGMPTPPSMRKVNPADAPVFFLAVSSDVLPLSDVNEAADKMVSQRLSMVNGVAQVTVYGSQKYAIRIQPNPLMLTARNLGLDEVITAVQRGSSNLALGTLYARDRNYTIKDAPQPKTADEYVRLPVVYRNGGALLLGDVATVMDSVENTRSASWLNGRRAVTLAIQKQPGTNTLEVIDSIRKAMPSIETDLPPSIKLETLFDRSISIRNAVNDIQFTLVLTVILVVGVIYLFLGNLSATWIAALALPMAVIGTFAIMKPLGFSLDNLSLMALTLSVGFVIDDAIVVLENITRYREMGWSPREASIKGTEEITFTVLSMTLSLVAVFIPILFMGGLLGRLFNEFAVTMAIAILVSGFISLSLTPMLCSRFLRPAPVRHNIVVRAFLKMFEWMEGFYRHSLQAAISAKLLTLMLFFVSCGFTVMMFAAIPAGFIPTEDTGQINGSTEAAQGIPFQEMSRLQFRVAEIVRRHPGVQSVMASVDSSNTGRLMVTLKPAHERPKADAIIRELQPKLRKITGLQTFFQVPAAIRLGGRAGKSLYQYTLQSPDTQALYAATTELQKRLAAVPGLEDVTSDLEIKNPEIQVAVNQGKMTALGLSRQQVEAALGSAFSSQQIATVYTSNNDYQVIMELPAAMQHDINSLNLVYLRSSNTTATTGTNGANNSFNRGALIPLGTVITAKRSAGPLSVNHQGQFPATTISFNLAPNVSLGGVLKPIQRVADQVLPDNVHAGFQGTAQAFGSSFEGLGWLLLIAVVVIYIVLGVLYESFIHPVTILSGLPPAGLGALLTLALFGQELNIYGFLGLIMLIGIVKKNAIMMIDFAIEAQRGNVALRNLPDEQAQRGNVALRNLPDDQAQRGNVTLSGHHTQAASREDAKNPAPLMQTESSESKAIASDPDASPYPKLEPEEAIFEAALVRFRPIMMTTLAALMGTFPIAIGFGEGVEARRGLGLAVFGGLLVSQLLTLYITPVLYIYMERVKNWFAPPPPVEARTVG